MNILVINSGSSSLKFQFIDMTNESVICKGLCERIGMEGSVLKYEPCGRAEVVLNQPLPDHTVAIQAVLDTLQHPEYGVINSLDEVTAVGHRVVHGLEHFRDSVLIEGNVLDLIKSCVDVAPLHNPANIAGIEACQKLLPNTPMVAVFDTAFHQTMNPESYLYAIPYSLYEKYKIRKYGFHGTSHKYVSEKAAEAVGKPLDSLKIITCHLGNGASLCAINKGKSVDTTMGFSPLEGLVMGTRSGSIDPGVVFFLMEKENMNCKDINNLLNKKSGMLGVSEISSDFRDIESAIDNNNEKAELALSMFCYKVKKYIGAYAAAMNGVDLIIFTAGIGENDWLVREKVLENLEWFGISIDKEKNRNYKRQSEFELTAEGSKVRTFIIRTNEELVIARDTKNIVNSLKK